MNHTITPQSDGWTAFIRRHGWVILFALFLVTRGGLFLAIRPWDEGRRATHFLVSDAAEYYWTARNMLAGHNYSSSPAPPYPSDATRTPLYPLFLATIIRGIGDSVAVVVLMQMLLQLGTIALVYAGARRLFSDVTAFCLALYCVLDPVYAVMSGVVYSETLHQVFNVVFAYALVRGVRGGFTVAGAVCIGLFFGLGLLTRPFALYLAPMVLFVIIASERTLGALGKSAVAAACALVVLFPWLHRNAEVFGTWSMSSVDGTSLQKFYMAPFLAAREGLSLEAARARLATETPEFGNPFERGAFIKRQTVEIIRRHPLQYAVFHLTSAWPALTGSNSEALEYLLSAQGVAGRNGDERPPPRQLWRFALIGGNLALLAALYGSFALGLWRLFRDRQWLQLLLLASALAYLPAITGPMSSSRYRLGVVPFLLYGAGVGLQWVEQRDRGRSGELSCVA